MTNPYVGFDDLSGDAEQELASLLSGDDDELGLDELGAAVRRMKAKKRAGKGGAMRGNTYEVMPITRTTIAAGATVTVNVSPTRSQKLEFLEFASSLVDHQFVRLLSVNILGVNQFNGGGGMLCSQLHEMRTNPVMSGSTAQAGQNVEFVFQNIDAVNARTIDGVMGGPALRQIG